MGYASGHPSTIGLPINRFPFRFIYLRFAEHCPNFVRLLLKRHQTEGTIEPKPHTGGFDSKLANHLDLVKQLIEQDNDATLQELCTQLEQQAQIQVSPSTFCRTLQQLNLTRKKTFVR